MQQTVETLHSAQLTQQKVYFRCNWRLHICTENDDDCAEGWHCVCRHKWCTTSAMGL